MSAPRRRLFLAAGEASGDLLGAALMRDLRRLAPDIEISGIGGDAMATEGITSLFPMSDLSVMGFLPVVKRLPSLLRRIRQTADAIIAAKPDLAIFIDAQDFSKRGGPPGQGQAVAAEARALCRAQRLGLAAGPRGGAAAAFR